MENREILIANTKTQKRSKITTAATTLGELKAALAEAGVDYSGMTFTEGISKTQLIDDATQLPHDVMYKGQPTNNLVILLINTKKNIASGASDRAAVYMAIKDNNLQDAVKEHFGRNFTQVPTEDLWNFIGGKPAMPIAEVKEITAEEETPEEHNPQDLEKKLDIRNVKEASISTKVASGVFFMIAQYIDTELITFEEAKNLAKNIVDYAKENEEEEEIPYDPVSTSDGSITDDDIDDMINDIL